MLDTPVRKAPALLHTTNIHKIKANLIIIYKGINEECNISSLLQDRQEGLEHFV